MVGLLRVGSFALFAFLTRSLALDGSGIFGQGPEVWVPLGGLLLIGWVGVLSAGRIEPSGDDRAIALAGLPALGLAGVVMIVIWLAPAVRADVVLDLGLVVVGGMLVLMPPRVTGRAVAYVPVAALAVVAVVCAFSGAELAGGIGETHVAPRNPASVASYRRAFGTVTFDASRWRGVAGRTERVNLRSGSGTFGSSFRRTSTRRLMRAWGAASCCLASRTLRELLLRAPANWRGNPARRRDASASGPAADQRPGRRRVLIVTQPGDSFSDSNC